MTWTKNTKIGALIIGILAGGAYWYYMKTHAVSTVPSYVTAQAARGTLIVSLSGSGQVSATNQVELTPKMPGTVTSVLLKNGAKVKAGQLIATLNTTDLAKAVRDAKTSLETAQLSLDKLNKPAEPLTLMQAQNSLANARDTKQKAIDDQANLYSSIFNNIADTYLDLPTVMTGMHDTMFSSSIGGGQWNIDYYASVIAPYDEKALTYKQDAYDKYDVARKAYDASFAKYKMISRTSDNAALESMLTETYATAKLISDAVKSSTNVIQFYKDKMIERTLKPLAISDTHLAALNGYTTQTNSHVNSLESEKQSLSDNKQSIANSDKTIAEKQQSLANVQAGPDSLDLRSQQLTVEARRNALYDAQQKYADAFIRVPFDGTLAKVSVKLADSVSSGTSVATLITDQQLATISLNEVDVAKVKTNQQATMTFDAVPDLILTGHVAEIDTIGTTAQNVVTYGVKISFDTQDDRVRPGMSTSATIILSAKPDALMIPRAALKTQGQSSYVQTLDTPSDGSTPSSATPTRIDVTVGLTNDDSVEVLTGVKEGDNVITRTIQPGTTAPKPATSLIPLPGAGGGAFRGATGR